MEFKQLFLFLLIAVSSFGAFYILWATLPIIGSNPLIMIAIFSGIAVAFYIIIQYVMNMNSNINRSS